MGKHRSQSCDDRRASFRGQRIEQLLREELNAILDLEVSDPRLEDTRVRFVELSRDGSRARIWFSTTDRYGQSSVIELERAFARASSFFRRRLCEALSLKRTPELCFRYDPAIADLEASHSDS